MDQSDLAVPKAHPRKSIHFDEGATNLTNISELSNKAPLVTQCHRTWFEEM